MGGTYHRWRCATQTGEHVQVAHASGNHGDICFTCSTDGDISTAEAHTPVASQYSTFCGDGSLNQVEVRLPLYSQTLPLIDQVVGLVVNLAAKFRFGLVENFD